MSKRVKIILIGVVIMAFISYIIYMGRMLASSGKANWIGMQNVLPSDTSLTDFDSTLFQPRQWKFIRPITVWRNKIREPIYFFSYDSLHYLIVNRIKLNDSLVTASSVKFENRSADIANNGSFRVTGDGDYFKFYAHGNLDFKFEEILLTIDGDSVQKNSVSDKNVNFYSKCKNISVKFSKNDSIDIFLETPRKYKKRRIPINIAFCNSNGYMNIVLLFPIEYETGITNGMIDKIISE